MKALIIFNILFLIEFIIFDIFIFKTYINKENKINYSENLYNYNIIINEEEENG